jgi:hypothetical protein
LVISAPGNPVLFPLEVVSQSMAKTFKRCPLQFKYKYLDELSPRVQSKPLTRGKWFHELLETYYAPQDTWENGVRPSWEDVNDRLTKKFATLFDEEKDELGDLPREMKRLMESYLWHYAGDTSWIVHEVEKTIEVPLPGVPGVMLRLRLDMIVEDEYGLWIVDHKTHKQIPQTTDRILDIQSPIYVWACNEVGIPVNGFKWNYIRTKVPSTPKMAYVGTARQGLSKAACDTDYLTYVRTINQLKKEYGLKVTKEIMARANQLKNQRYNYHSMQTSEFFLRMTLERSDEQIQRAIRELAHTARRILEYDFSEDSVERNNDSRMCKFMCGYRDLCITEYMGGNATLVRSKQFITQDPWAYYGEGKPDAPE